MFSSHYGGRDLAATLWGASVGARCWTLCGKAHNNWCWRTTATSLSSSCALYPKCLCSHMETRDLRCCLLHGKYGKWGHHFVHSLVWAQRTATVHLWLWPGWRRAPGTRHRPLPPRSSTGLCCWHSHTESRGGGSTRRSSLLQGPFAGSTDGLEGVKGWRWGEGGVVPGTNCSWFSLVAPVTTSSSLSSWWCFSPVVPKSSHFLLYSCLITMYEWTAQAANDEGCSV